MRGLFLGVKMKTIKLTQGKYTLVDDEEFDKLNQYKWHAEKAPYTYYAVRSVGSHAARKRIRMSRFIMNAPEKMYVDHINHDGLDNRKENLRICTHAENSRNKKSHIDGSSEYLGVSHRRYFKKNGNYSERWVTEIMFCNKRIYIGRYRNEIDAALSYNQKAVELFGEFANLNEL